MNNKMTYSQAEQLKAHIRSRLSGSIAQALNPNPSARRQFNMSGNNPALNPDEFHNKSYVAGSTGEYKDMEGGAHFNNYDCGHEYNDSVIRNVPNKKQVLSEDIRSEFHNKQSVRKAFIMSEIFERPARRKRYSDKFR